MLSARIKARKTLIQNAITPKGSRPPFTQQLSQANALEWWMKHRYDDLGQQVLSNMQPADVMELDRALSQRISEG